MSQRMDWTIIEEQLYAAREIISASHQVCQEMQEAIDIMAGALKEIIWAQYEGTTQNAHKALYNPMVQKFIRKD